MRLGFSTGDTVGRAGAILNVAKYLAELPVGSVVRNGCDSIEPEAARHVSRQGAEYPIAGRARDHGHEWEWFDPTTPPARTGRSRRSGSRS